ncbi:bifunctional metallophosphatase/5'-nucleotidase [Paucidesulfovibrio longus]|uniref:bifunctional metallophosphatase/5'-nucleotidase n=1 Tax=Paucidesulfovibrio longus TaxID=889 RepID=UPI0009DBAB03|nr:bifunctional metallophosphatase/5'-nucleotidase [Paucidesulfovibrio longus]
MSGLRRGWKVFSERGRFAALLALLLAVWGFCLTGTARAETFRLTILHTNDIHAHLAPFDKYGAQCSPEKDAAGECAGGAARLAAAVAAVRGERPNVVLFDAGDQFQGTLFYTKYKGLACAALMNLLGYDAMTLGNHEFDDGPASLAEFLKQIRFPAVSSNLRMASASPLVGLIRPWVMLDVNGRKVGVVGVSHPQTPMMSSPGLSQFFFEPNASVTMGVYELRRAGANIIIVLSHLGLEGDKKLATRMGGMDVIVGGHSHVLLANGDPEAVGPCPLVQEGPDGEPVLLVTAGYWGRYLGVLEVEFDEQGRILSSAGNPLPMDAKAPKDPAAAAEVERLEASLRTLQTRVLGQTLKPMSSEDCRARECLPGDLRADAILAESARHGVVAALVNGGSVRSGFAAGPITFGDVLSAYPFTDNVVELTLSGADLRAVLEHGLSALGGYEGTGRFLQVAGIRYRFDSRRPAGKRLLEASVVGPDGTTLPLADAAEYRVALSRFLYRGGDSYSIFAERGKDVFLDGKTMTTVMEEYVSAHSPLALEPDGRVLDLAHGVPSQAP